MDLKLRRRERVRQAAAFRRVFKDGRRFDGRLFTLVAAPSPAGLSRLGLAVGRRLGGAVARNRVKRLLRESYRRQKPTGVWDLIVVAKPQSVGRPQAELAVELRRLVERVHRTLRPRREERPAAAD